MRSEERLGLVAGGKGMLTDVGVLKEMRERGEILRWGCEESLDLDVTHLEPGNVARIILEWVEEVDGGGVDGRKAARFVLN